MASGARAVVATDVASAVLGLVFAGLVAWIHRSTPLTAAFLAGAVLVSAWLSAIDFREFRLPNRIVGPLAIVSAIWIVAAGIAAGDLGQVGRALAFAVAAFVVLFGMNIVAGFGMGDVKYGTVATLILGWFGGSAISAAVMVTAISGGVIAAAMLVRGQRDGDLAYGPYLALGLVGGLVAAGV